ncbi:MAG: hypothetical protein PQJ60_00190 [Spirochaetales bacterium]|nr:hypothetical protein [Spirochaetales bacterium]
MKKVKTMMVLTAALFALAGCGRENKLTLSRTDYPTDLTEEEKSHPLARYYYGLAPLSDEAREAMVYKPVEGAVPYENINEILEADSEGYEGGFSRFDDMTGYVAVNTSFPGATAEMLDWWFDWVGYDVVRYKIWYPGLHAQALYPEGSHREGDSYSLTQALEKNPEGKIKHTIEAIPAGGKLNNLYIHFVDPAEFGLDPSRLGGDQWAFAAIVYNGPFEVARMVHFVRTTDRGVEMRSRFWMGENLPRFMRKRASTDEQLYNMAYHCAQEYHQLASFLPEVYEEYAGE